MIFKRNPYYYIMCYNYDPSTIKCYYLLYKLIINETLWIVKISDNYYDLIDNIYNVKSYNEKYYIVSKKIPEITFDYKFKHFTQFNFDNHCKIQYETL